MIGKSGDTAELETPVAGVLQKIPSSSELAVLLAHHDPPGMDGIQVIILDQYFTVPHVDAVVDLGDVILGHCEVLGSGDDQSLCETSGVVQVVVPDDGVCPCVLDGYAVGFPAYDIPAFDNVGVDFCAGAATYPVLGRPLGV